MMRGGADVIKAQISAQSRQCACIILQPYPYLETHYMEQLSSMKMVSGAKKVGDCYPKISRNNASLPTL